MQFIDADGYRRNWCSSGNRASRSGVIWWGRTTADCAVTMSGPCWRAIGTEDIRFTFIFELTGAVVRSMPNGSGSAKSVAVVTLNGPLGVDTVIGVGSVLVVFIRNLK